jgi:hypothetical protein
MKAKINFAGTKLEKHPNVLTFKGAVVQDDASAWNFYIFFKDTEHIILTK